MTEMTPEVKEAYRIVSQFRGLAAKKKLGREHYVLMGKKSGVVRNQIKTAKSSN